MPLFLAAGREPLKDQDPTHSTITKKNKRLLPVYPERPNKKLSPHMTPGLGIEPGRVACPQGHPGEITNGLIVAGPKLPFQEDVQSHPAVEVLDLSISACVASEVISTTHRVEPHLTFTR